MNTKKNILLHLYRDPDAEGDLRSCLTDEESRTEHRALSEARFQLDLMPRQKPDATSIEAIMLEARRAAGVADPGRRSDRPPIWKSRSLRRILIPALSMAAAVVFAVAYGVFGTDATWDRTTDSSISRADDALSPAESLLRPTPVPAALAARMNSVNDDPELAWDHASDVRRLYRRIESLRPADELDWNERSMPLELLPGLPAGNPNLQRASSPQR